MVRSFTRQQLYWMLEKLGIASQMEVKLGLGENFEQYISFF